MRKQLFQISALILIGTNVTSAWTTNHYIDNQTTTISGGDLTGEDYGLVIVNRSNVTNESNIISNWSGIVVNDSSINNSGSITATYGFESVNSNIVNNAGGTISSETGFLLNDSH